jgi:hypothetical protein
MSSDQGAEPRASVAVPASGVPPARGAKRPIERLAHILAWILAGIWGVAITVASVGWWRIAGVEDPCGDVLPEPSAAAWATALISVAGAIALRWAAARAMEPRRAARMVWWILLPAAALTGSLFVSLVGVALYPIAIGLNVRAGGTGAAVVRWLVIAALVVAGILVNSWSFEAIQCL